MTELAIEATGLAKSFGETQALIGVDLAVRQGNVLAVLGPNGAGKTTAVRILATLLRADAGTARVNGFDVRTQPGKVRASIGLTGQFASVDEDLTGTQNLVMIGQLLDLSTRAARQRAAELLAWFDLTEAANKVAKNYSGGMRRRLDLAASLVGRPQVIFLDEPTTGLDPAKREDMWDVVRSLVSDGSTVLLTTQYLEEADALADQVMIISAGRVADTGTTAELKARFGTVVFHLDFGGQEAAQTAQTALTAAGYQPQRDGAGIQVRSAAGSGELTGMLRVLDGRAPDPVSVEIREPTLDDVFLSLTRGGEAA